ncbi:P-loop containing nucleoside triphosphate hydrolase protein [Thamnocephalis sphaerospora]|uniref:Mitochondrial GTPase 1 n=1 Tax=Thamnocephalis sphaerospora TaxID=78915 RepID=A0A4P9XQ67_9FUNG|nr:P-loop containing nucleoside triphosphate hydrolase protein [Thamnocephalis sphaerospora]|eukprot:RKP08173.1 P-loop containing nucleoside triphosphate hydrolase protein [Thamnocephalis sphaerospora]
MSAFRQTFTYHRSINWFPGHMARGIRQIKERLQRDVDLVVEFERLARRKRRLIVYNKADLADPAAEEPIRQAFTRQAHQSVVFTDANNNTNVDVVLQHAADAARQSAQRLARTTVMVVGMPNVGKSSIINALRRQGLGRGKAAVTGAQPGVTRTVAGTVKVLDNPEVHLLDTPGVMIPHIEDPITSLKVAVTGGIRDHLADEEMMADYLLFRLNQLGNAGYTTVLGLESPTDDVHRLLMHVAARIGAIRRGGEVDLSAAAMFFLRKYRDGRFGRLTLDDVNASTIAQHLGHK